MTLFVDRLVGWCTCTCTFLRSYWSVHRQRHASAFNSGHGRKRKIMSKGRNYRIFDALPIFLQWLNVVHEWNYSELLLLQALRTCTWAAAASSFFHIQASVSCCFRRHVVLQNRTVAHQARSETRVVAVMLPLSYSCKEKKQSSPASSCYNYSGYWQKLIAKYWLIATGPFHGLFSNRIQ